MSNQEINFLLLEVADLRHEVGGRSITLDDRQKKRQSVDAELNGIQEALVSLQKTVDQLKKELANAQIVATTSLADAQAVSTLAQELQTSTESLEIALEEVKK